MTTAIQSLDASTSVVLVGGTEAFRFTTGGIKGTTVQSVYSEYTTNADLTAIIPMDDTIPQSNEGTQIITATITPRSTTNKVRVRFQCQWGTSSGALNVISALFVGASANAARASMNTNAGAGYAMQNVLEFEHVPGVTTALTYAIRIGPQTASTIRLNGTGTGRLFGGTMAATLILEEFAV